MKDKELAKWIGKHVIATDFYKNEYSRHDGIGVVIGYRNCNFKLGVVWPRSGSLGWLRSTVRTSSLIECDLNVIPGGHFGFAFADPKHLIEV